MKLRLSYLSQVVIIGAIALTGLSRPSPAGAQTRSAPPFQLKNIDKNMRNAPTYGANSGDLGGGRPSTIAREWLMLEVLFTSQPEWADDVKIHYYVLMGKGKTARLFTGEVTHVNIQRGSQHYSVMFMHPNTVRRYGAGRVEAVAAVLYYGDRPVSAISSPPSTRRWWEEFTPTPGHLLNQLETPWSVIAPTRFEALKSTNTK
jgi:hypothetical protein